MEQSKIVEGNILIAVFMDWCIDNSFPDKGRVYRNGNSLELDTTFKFHTSWDWLMPVIEKIESLGIVVTISNGFHLKMLGNAQFYKCKTHSYKDTKEVLYGERFGDTKIHAAWQAVVEFIEWHNN